MKLKKPQSARMGTKIIIGSLIIVSFFLLICYSSYAIFTSYVEKKSTLNITIGNLTPLLESPDITNDNKITIPASQSRVFTVTIKNINSVAAKYLFTYQVVGMDTIPSTIEIGYLKGTEAPPSESGLVLPKSGEVGNAKTYQLVARNKSTSPIVLQLDSQVGLKDASLILNTGKGASTKQYFTKALIPFYHLNQVLTDLAYLGSNASTDTTTKNGTTYIKGSAPNNFVWFAGYLFHAISVEGGSKIKLETDQVFGGGSLFDSTYSTYTQSDFYPWLNTYFYDRLGPLKNTYLLNTVTCMDSTTDYATKRTTCTNSTTSKIGLISADEINIIGTSSYLYEAKGIYYWTSTPYPNGSNDHAMVYADGSIDDIGVYNNYGGVRPVITLGNDPLVIGKGTRTDPYRIEEEPATTNTLLKNRFSGEHIKYDNKLWRILDIDSQGIKAYNVDPVSAYGEKPFQADWVNAVVYYNPLVSTNIGYYLNRSISLDTSLLVTNATWYRSTFDTGTTGVAYQTALQNTNPVSATVGLPRLFELISTLYNVEKSYWTMTTDPTSEDAVYTQVYDGSIISESTPEVNDARAAVYFKNTTKIVSGIGTETDPYTLQ